MNALIGAIAASSNLVVIDVNGNIRTISDYSELLPGEVVLTKGDDPMTTEAVVDAAIVDAEGNVLPLDTDDEIAQIIGQLEAGQDPTQLGEEFATAAGETQGSAVVRAPTIERVGAESLATTSFNTTGLEGQGLTEIQADTLLTTLQQFINSTPSVSLTGILTDIDENTDTSVRIKIADITITDDEQGINDLSLSGTDADKFEIIGSELYLRAGVVLDHESFANYDVNVVVTDPTLVGVTPESTSATLLVNDVNEAPEVSSTIISGTAEGKSSYEIDLLKFSSDVDDGDVLRVANVTNLPPGFTSSNNLLTIDPSNKEYDSLADGETKVIEVTYDVVDSGGLSVSQTATITIEGTNDKAKVADVTAEGKESDALFNVNLLKNSSDVDGTDILKVEEIEYKDGDNSGVIVNADTGQLEVTPSTYNSLASGEKAEIKYTYDVVEYSKGGKELSRTATEATITITGENDDATVTAISRTASEDENQFTINLLSNSNDVDKTDVLSINNLKVDPIDAIGITEQNGFVTIDPKAYNSLALGEQAKITYSYNVIEKDDEGKTLESHPTTATIIITGRNDAPVFNSVITTPDGKVTSISAIEDKKYEGTLTVSDVDNNDVQTYTISEGAANGTVSIDPETGAYSYIPDGNYSGTDSFEVTVTDKHNATDTVVVNVVVKPVADLVDLTVVPNEGWSQSMDFNDIKFNGSWTSQGSAKLANDAQDDVDWGTNNHDQKFEVGHEGLYKDSSSTNTVMELEGDPGDRTFTAGFKAEQGEVLSISFDISARRLAANNDTDSDATLKLVYQDTSGAQHEQLLYVFDPSSTDWQSIRNENKITFQIPGGAADGEYKLVFESADENTQDTYGALIDNLEISSLANTGYEDSDIKINEITAGLQDSSETLHVELHGLPTGTVVSDGVNTATILANNVYDISGLDLSKLTVNIAEPNKYNVNVIAYSEESDGTFGDENSKPFTINVLEARAAPVFDSVDGNLVYDENRVAGETIASVKVADPDDVTTYEITGGNSNGWFAINDKGEISLTAKGALEAANDFEDSGDIDEHDLTITAEGKGGVAQIKVTLEESDVNEAPTTDNVILLNIVEDSGAHLITSADLLENANDIENDNLVVTDLKVDTGNGSLVKGSTEGTWLYTPAENDDSDVTFTY
ncbi:cadherin-like domain-containing protein, partial [Vibrio sp. 99-8-1]|uniref:cadherin-like domain-containing protein n=1 Tax=Vibrio sp. 99-8-1 TaxID=2607602 RepID=UPI0014936FA8